MQLRTVPTGPARPTRPARRLRSRAAAAALAITTVTAALSAAPAFGDDRNAPVDPQTALTHEYSSLSGALLNLYAQNSGQTLKDYLASQQVLLSPPAMTDPVAAAKNPAAAGDGSELPTDTPTGVPTGTPTGSSTTGPTLPAVDDPSAPATPSTGTGSGAASLTLPTVPALGTADALGAAAADAKPVTARTLAELNTQLAGAGLNINVKGYTSLDALARGVVAKSNTLDGAVTLAGAKWMSSLATLRTPTLKTPTSAMATMPGLPKDALVFGLFADKSLTAMINSSPNMFAAVGKSGLGTKAASDAWNKSMLSVYNSSRADFSKVLPDPCTGGMLAVMASGNGASAKKVSGSGCNPACVTGGLYLNSQTSGMFAPGTATTKANPYSSLWNGTTLNGLQRWQQQQLLGQNPNLTNQLLKDTRPVSSASCSASSTATSNALNATMPGIFAQLRTK